MESRQLFLLILLVDTGYGLGGGCILDGLGEEYSPEATALRYKEKIFIGSGPVQGVHLSLAGTNQMRITWLNPTPFQNKTFKPMCYFGNQPSNTSVESYGKAYSYPDGMFDLTLNSALLDLGALTEEMVFYRCGDSQDGFFSPIYNFTLQSTNITNSRKSLRFKSMNRFSKLSNPFDPIFDPAEPLIAVIGDHGVKRGSDTATSIAGHVKNDDVQLIVHVGDISYADKYGSNNSYIWVSYMNMQEPATSLVPYMTTVGNHERQFQFAAYLNWLGYSMPTSGSGSNFWYSFDYMGIHFVAYSSEHDLTPNSTQHTWMAQDLVKANGNRETVPWIIVYGHRPLYCTSLICAERCLDEAPVFRADLEDLLYQQHVDVVFHGHNHQYERSYPVYKEKAVQKDYINPKAPVYIVDGAAGNPELNDPSFRPGVEWRAFDDPTFYTGYVLMQPSPTELKFQYINSNKKEVVDQFVISRTN
ncbi:hypothetical protein LOTGIDRAFT_231325 [Lottia gigantea]|uniref:Purple acid phosphatase n=1 Tax=Lottia gigantea TaxID=225164 RepID=V4A2W4_LOTGI|nr:hypothetical protein LOTGIDRAFT_231325 [Lottia gigantea]ESO98203.1 hypothetical protein LOTGIDRAFT_231325 [Lottia gigantea]